MAKMSLKQIRKYSILLIIDLIFWILLYYFIEFANNFRLNDLFTFGFYSIYVVPMFLIVRAIFTVKIFNNFFIPNLLIFFEVLFYKLSEYLVYPEYTNLYVGVIIALIVFTLSVIVSALVRVICKLIPRFK